MGINYINIFEMFSALKEQAEKYKNGEIIKNVIWWNFCLCKRDIVGTQWYVAIIT